MIEFPRGVVTDYESKTVSTSVVTLTASKLEPNDAPPVDAAFITVEAASIRVRLDGVNPTATEGHLFEAGEGFAIYGINSLRQFKAIRAQASDATIRISYYLR